uniref:Uncharacterized protein n=1 Tax=Oncorhynchus mykiss TaxID=8022 RepID=A0A8C7VVP6_ONCMY
MHQGVADSPVILVIKAPDQRYDDQTINCFLNWTVDKLKTHISHLYPSKPVSCHVHSDVGCLDSENHFLVYLTF